MPNGPPRGSPAGSSPPPDHVRPCCFELRVIPRTPAINDAEAALANALTVTVGGTRPVLSSEQVRDHLSRFFAIGEGEVQVKRYNRADFLLVFANRQLADRVLHTPPLLQACRWNQQAGALFKPFRFKILLSVTNVPAHVRSVETVQEIVGSSCLVSEVSPRSLDQSDLSRFLVVVWARHPYLVPTEVACSVSKPADPFVDAQRPLFLRAHEIIHSKCNLLHFRTFVHIVEVHDFDLPESSNNDGLPPSSDSSDDEYPGFDNGRGICGRGPKSRGSSPTTAPPAHRGLRCRLPAARFGRLLRQPLGAPQRLSWVGPARVACPPGVKGDSVRWQEAGWDGRAACVSRCMPGAGLPCTANQ
jgi:hypothetical protein